MGRENRSFYRFQATARLSFVELEPQHLESARLRVRTRSRGISSPLAVGDDTFTSAEQHAHLVLLQQILYSLDRLNERVDELAEQSQGTSCGERVTLGMQEISLSGSGFRFFADVELEAGAVIEARIDMWESGLPLILCVARVVSTQKVGKMYEIALNFEELLPEDRERIVQLSIRRQSLDLRGSRTEIES